MVTADDVRDELAFDEIALDMDTAEFDALLEDLIGRETERVVDAIGVVLGTETATETLSRPSSVDGPFLPLPKRPVVSLESVEITDNASGPAVGVGDVIVEDTHLELEPSAERNSWPTDRRSVSVEWTHGYPEGEEPDAINGAIIGLVRHALQEIEADGVENESIGGDSVSYELGDDVLRRHLIRAKRFDEPSFYGGSNVV